MHSTASSADELEMKTHSAAVDEANGTISEDSGKRPVTPALCDHDSLTLHKALELLFNSILDRLASLDEFSRRSCPSIFIVYAHDNPEKGEAKAEVVRRIIHWLERSRCRVVSDKAPLEPFPGTQEDTTTVRNILDSQFRLLPHLVSGSELGVNASVDKVVICGSEVLENYARDAFTTPFIEAVKEAYRRPGHAKDDIRKLVETNTQMEGFHHVLTELAFLDIRRSGDRSDHGIIPLALSGNLPGTYLPFIEKCDVVLKKEQSTHLAEQHRLLFKLLTQIYTHSHAAIHQFKSCYEDAVKDLNKQGSIDVHAANRIIMSRLDSASRAYLDHVTAATRVNGTARDEVEHKTKKRRLKVLKTLSPLPYRDRKDRNQVREKGTCIWATTHPRFEGWKHSSAASLLWISADPGCGKSVLARSLVDEVLPTSAASTTCYFFFKDDFSDQRTIENALRCILHQLFSQKPSLLSDELLSRFLGHGQLLSSARGLWDVLVQATGQADAGQVVCILDALDECEENGRKFLGEQLTAFYLRQESRAALKFLITSRPYLDIERDFRLLEDRMPTIRLAGENPAEAGQIEKEIDIVIKARAMQLKTIVRLSDDEYQVMLKGLTRVPNRNYLWVTLTFDVVRSAIRTTCADLEVILRELPADVDNAYERILSRNQGRASDSARAILKIIVAAVRPLSLLEMSQALALEESPAPNKTLQYQTEDEFRHTIRHLCGLFVTISDSKIYLLHQTARVFLLRNLQSTSNPSLPQHPYQWRQSLLLAECHCLLAQLCMKCLLFQPPSFAALAKYGETNWAWAFHLREAGHTTPTHDMFHQARRLCDTKYVKSNGLILRSPWPPFDQAYRFDRANQLYRLDEVHKSDSWGLTALMIASALGLNGIVRLLLNEKKAALHDVDYTKRSALFWACIAGHTEVVQTLLDKMSWVTSRRALRKGYTEYECKPLVLAVQRNHHAVVQLLLDRGAQVNAVDIFGFTALHQAAEEGYEDIARLLIDQGALVNRKSNQGKTPLSIAASGSHEAVAQLLLDRGANVNAVDTKGSTPLLQAAHRGYEAVVLLLLDRGAAVNLADDQHITPLLRAVIHNNEAVARLLLQRGAQVNAADQEGSAPLFEAAAWGNETVVQLLLDQGAQVNAADKQQNTPLLRAIVSGHVGTAKLLLDRGAHANPLYFSRSPRITQALLDAGAQNNVQDSFGRTPLHHAAIGHKSMASVSRLLERGASPEVRDNAGDTPLEFFEKQLEKRYRGRSLLEL